MKKKANNVLDQVLEQVNPDEKTVKEINSSLKAFLLKFNKRKKSLKIDAEIFVGGSFAKKTLIKKDNYDIDIFVRFNKKYANDKISGLTKKMLVGIKKVSTIHGSRDYFRVQINSNVYFELVPVMKVNNPKQSKNITDLSYSHVKYAEKKIKSKAILNDIKLAKAFCYANQCYGAESYIKGFSGYSLELLVYHYGGFIKFIRAMSKITTKDKKVIDIEKLHRNRSSILMDINDSKLQSPVILIDPTFKHRNVLAALSNETFRKFQKSCKKFLKIQSIKSFEIVKTDIGKIRTNALKKKFQFILLEAKTGKQKGDIAGSKLLKFYNHLNEDISRFFKISNKGFNYNDKQAARFFFVVSPKKEILLKGPELKDKSHLKAFKKAHKKTFNKGKRIYAREKISFSLKTFIGNWNKKNKKKIREMYIKGFKNLK
jgi:tRNA CCA-adding enzyme